MSGKASLLFIDSAIPYASPNVWRVAFNTRLYADGDSLWVERDEGCRDTGLIDCRVTGDQWRGFNAPERYTPDGKAATALVRLLCPPGSHGIIWTKPDPEKFGRWLTPIYLPAIYTTAILLSSAYLAIPAERFTVPLYEDLELMSLAEILVANTLGVWKVYA
jgi:hypothetical protein